MTSESSTAKTWLRPVLLVVIPLIIGLVSLVIYLMGGRWVETENAYVKAEMTPISSQVAGVVIERLVKQNDKVQKGQLLYRLDPKPYELSVFKAQANLEKVVTDLRSIKASYRERLADLDVANSKANFAQREKKRQESLAKQHLVAQQTFDLATHDSTVATQQVDGIHEDVKRIAETLGGRVDTALELHPSYLAAKAELERAQLDLAHTRIYATDDGFVTLPPEVGSYVSPGITTMTLVSSKQLWIEANFVETALANVHQGQQVRIKVDRFPGREWIGRVDSLSPATGAEFSVIPAQNATGNWVKIAQRVPVKIVFSSMDQLADLQAGLSSTIEIDTEHRRKLFGIGWL